MGLKAIVLAAGEGTRMKSSLPKVLHEVAGKSMISWVLDAVIGVNPGEVVVVVGHESDLVREQLSDGISIVVQSEQLGTGHATKVALTADGFTDDDVVLVVPGDAPLLRSATLERLVEAHAGNGAAATILTMDLDDPSGYGRVLRGKDGTVTAIVEDGDAAPEQLAITEVGTSIYAFDFPELADALARVDQSNVQGEQYLTDVVGILVGDGKQVAALSAPADEVAGVNSLAQLAGAAAEMRSRINEAWMADGVWMLEPERVYIEASVVLTTGVRLYPGVHLEGSTSVGAGAEIGPDVHVRDSRIGEDARVWYSVLDGVEVGARAEVGPYARLRPGTHLGDEAKAGTFVEMKKAKIGPRTKVPHLSYMGDAVVGEDTNVGAGSITCNYDGYEKHTTVIGDGVFIGSDTMLVAPVEVGDEAYTGAGSVITNDVAPGSLAVERSPQREVEDYAARRRKRAQKKADS